MKPNLKKKFDFSVEMSEAESIKATPKVALSSFFMCMIVANAAILHSGLIWKAVICCILIAVLGIGIALIVQKFLDRGK